MKLQNSNTMLKKIIFSIFVLLIIGMNYASNSYYEDKISIMASNTVGNDKSSSISASINGHSLSVVFTENLGQVSIEVSYASGGEVETSSIYTPSGVNIYIPYSGSYVVTFTLPNGDEYYGEFEVTE